MSDVTFKRVVDNRTQQRLGGETSDCFDRGILQADWSWYRADITTHWVN